MILERVTLKQSKTYCTRCLIANPIAHRPIVRDVDADLEQNQPSGVKSIDMHVSLASKYGSQVLLVT